MDKKELFEEFELDAENAGTWAQDVASYDTFMDMWGKYFPHVTIREVS